MGGCRDGLGEGDGIIVGGGVVCAYNKIFQA